MSEEQETLPEVGVFNMEITTSQENVQFRATFDPPIKGEMHELQKYPGYLVAVAGRAVAETLFDLDATEQALMWTEVMTIVEKYHKPEDQENV